LCVMDERGTGNGWLLPAGPLREPWPRPVDAVLHTGLPTVSDEPHEQDQAPRYQAPRQLADHALTATGQRVALSTLASQPVDAVAGLARPEGFFKMLRESGLTLAHTHALPDHHDFQDWQATPTGRRLLCTEKDAAKLWPHQPDALAVPLVVTPEPAFWTALDERIQQLLSR